MIPLLTRNYTAGGAIGANLIVKLSADTGVVVAAAATDPLVGVAPNFDIASGDPVDVHHAGIADVKLGGSVTRGDKVTSDAAGKGVTATTSGSYVIGTALESGSDGDIIPVLLDLAVLNAAAATLAPGEQLTVTAAAADGAIAVKTGLVVITKAGVAALTLAAPTNVTDDGKRLTILATTANAHTVTQASAGFNGAGAGGDVATFGGAVGDCLQLVAYNAKWWTVGLLNVTLG